MHKLIILIRNRCILTSAFGNSIPIQNTPVANEKQPYIISNQPQQPFPATFTMKV